MAISIYVSSAFLSINTSAVLRIYMPDTVVRSNSPVIYRKILMNGSHCCVLASWFNCCSFGIRLYFGTL
jgi:hypothetical protein